MFNRFKIYDYEKNVSVGGTCSHLNLSCKL